MSYENQVANGVYNNSQIVAPSNYPGKTLGLVALVLSLLGFIGLPTPIAGLVTGYFAMKQSKDAGFKNSLALLGVIFGWVFVVIWLLILLLVLVLIFGTAGLMGGLTTVA